MSSGTLAAMASAARLCPRSSLRTRLPVNCYRPQYNVLPHGRRHLRPTGQHQAMSTVEFDSAGEWSARVPLVIIGAGATGLCAALAAKEAGVEAVLVERDAVPSGSTALSAGLIPAAGTSFQRAKAIADSPDRLAADIARKANGDAVPALVEAVARGSGPAIEWLVERYNLPFDLIDNFNYPGHSTFRMHGLAEPQRSRADRSPAQCR